MIAAGADVNTIDPCPEAGTALHLAAFNMAENVDTLVAAGASASAKGAVSGGEPLHVAAERGQLGAAEARLRHDADINARTTPAGQTPLHLAAANVTGSTQGLVHHLLKGWANEALADSDGNKPVDVIGCSMLGGVPNEAAEQEVRELLQDKKWGNR